MRRVYLNSRTGVAMRTVHCVELPNWRNHGVLLRAIVVAELLRLVSVLTDGGTSVRWETVFLTQGVVFEPTLLTVLLLLFGLQPGLRRVAYRQGVCLVLLVSGAVAAAWQWLLQAQVLHEPGRPLWQTVAVAMVTAAAVLFYFNWRHHRLSPAWAESRLMALQARIQPHFLFNSLNSVMSLLTEDPQRAEAMLQDLCDLYRSLLADSRQLVPLSQELAVARAYLHIESIRFGERLRVQWLCDHAPAQAMVPPLLLQPLLENAVRHGVAPLVDGGTITVEAYTESDQLLLFVRNPLPQPSTPSQVVNGNRMALENLRERLALHFDAEASLKVQHTDDEFTVQVRMPVR